ncbi:phospholipid scramblase 1-like [Pieris brassicae]|uniref:phospholipid scramblase 1-like n=1 Tax=Pieris brassicae TaxID=7116 RepID=UPI001E65F628|nr:phospholipid scramblase 1-like [Pieris brassicae]
MKTQEDQWMPCPQIETKYPGLAYLCPLNKLIVAKKRDSLHNLFGNDIIGYTIYNGQGQKVFLAVQRKETKKEIKIFNSYGNEVIHLQRRTFCFNKLLVWTPPGRFVGSVHSKCLRVFIKNYRGDVLKIKPRGVFCCARDIFSEGERIGEVAPRNCLHSIKNGVSVVFPFELDVELKSILLGACFLIGY